MKHTEQGKAPRKPQITRASHESEEGAMTGAYPSRYGWFGSTLWFSREVTTLTRDAMHLLRAAASTRFPAWMSEKTALAGGNRILTASRWVGHARREILPTKR